MRSVDEMRTQADRVYERGYPQWMASCLRHEAAGIEADDWGCEEFSYSLQPPSEAAASVSIAATKQWVAQWCAVSRTHDVAFEQRAWNSLGHQRIPVRLGLRGVRDLAAFAGRGSLWGTCERRAKELARIAKDAPRADIDECAAATKVCAWRIAGMEDADWRRTCEALKWLIEHPNVAAYSRELPVRGLDTKWIEGHKQTVFTLAKALIGHEPYLMLRAPGQYRVRILDAALAVGLGEGLDDLSLVPEQLDRLPARPDNVVICENLISLMTLPTLARTIGICGSGYAAIELSSARWLADLDVVYWGDLDVDGLAILSGVREHLPHVRSVMMDKETLLAHKDLCVVETSSHRKVLDNLTVDEREAYVLLADGKKRLRLEQERIPYSYVCEKLKQALEMRGQRMVFSY